MGHRSDAVVSMFQQPFLYILAYLSAVAAHYSRTRGSKIDASFSCRMLILFLVSVELRYLRLLVQLISLMSAIDFSPTQFLTFHLIYN